MTRGTAPLSFSPGDASGVAIKQWQRHRNAEGHAVGGQRPLVATADGNVGRRHRALQLCLAVGALLFAARGEQVGTSGQSLTLQGGPVEAGVDAPAPTASERGRHFGQHACHIEFTTEVGKPHEGQQGGLRILQGQLGRELIVDKSQPLDLQAPQLPAGNLALIRDALARCQAPGRYRPAPRATPRGRSSRAPPAGTPAGQPVRGARWSSESFGPRAIAATAASDAPATAPADSISWSTG